MMVRRAFLAAGVASGQGTALRVEPVPPFPGSPVLFSLAAGPAEGKWLDRTVEFALDEPSKRWVALAAVGLDTKPGRHILELGDGERHTVRIAPHGYRTGRITVPPKFVQPPKAESQRIAEEREIKKAAFAARTKRVWAGAFEPPTGTVRTSPFGTRRTYNGKTQSIHQGLDFRAAVGTPVAAANHGRVAIAQEMYFEGGLVALDHGGGLFSLYMHLSEFAVKEGAKVKKGQTLGASGSSGRVTGPHVHFAVQWQGLYMDPATLLALRLLAT